MNIYLFLSITFFLVSLLSANYKTKHIFNVTLNVFFVFIYLIITIMYLSADYFTGKGITQAVLFTLKSGLSGAGFGEYIVLILVSLLSFVFIVILSYLYLRFIKNRSHPKIKRIKGIVHNVFLLLSFLMHPFNLDLYSIYMSMNVKQSTDFHKYYRVPDLAVEQTSKYNLVYIYAESLEKTYFDESLFPGLMESLKSLKKSSIEFTNINQVAGTGWTAGGMTATQCAIPLFTPSHGNSMNGVDSFLGGATCLGDVLKFSDYHLVFMQGSSVEFSGIKKLYFTHKFDEVYGIDELQERIKDKEYRNGWGLYDDTLFPLVYNKFEELSKVDKPFALFMATIDTHHPNGMTSKSCKDIPYGNGENSILNAVHCSDRLLSQFIQKIQNSKYAKNTLIVLTSDHLAMRNTATSLLAKGKRRDLFLIFDPVNKKYISIDKEGSMLDVSSTVLSKLDINEYFGLGRNLFFEESLFVQISNFNKKLLSWRESILKFWQFATIGRSYNIDIEKGKINIGLHSYKIPILAKIGKGDTVTPLFEFNSAKNLDEYIAKFLPDQKFIWVDKCSKINFLFDLELIGNLCVAQGALSSSTIEAKSLSDYTTTMDTNSVLNSMYYDNTIYHKRINKLKELYICRKPLAVNRVALLSSRVPTLVSIPSAIATPNHFFPISQKLNLLSRSQDGEYAIQEFDVYAGEIAANQFLETIEKLIEKKKFWAIVAQHNTISSSYPEYNKKLAKLGFKLLPKLDYNASYIAYSDINGTIYEYIDRESKCKVIPSFIK